MFYRSKLISSACLFSVFLSSVQIQAQDLPMVTIAILAKDKAHTLPLFLKCIESQTWPTEQTYLYIRTNNNNDDTVAILRDWVAKVQDRYPRIYFNDQDVSQKVEQYAQHHWNGVRFKVLGKIRQESVDWAYENNSHYFVVDCDNFIKPHALQAMVETGLSIVAPFLKCLTWYGYSNYHAAVDLNGYFAHCPEYSEIYHQVHPGIHAVPVIHCSYFIRHDLLPKMVYDDESYRYEYVIFSDTARKNSIDQYLNNQDVYGLLTFAETVDQLENDPAYNEVQKWLAK